MRGLILLLGVMFGVPGLAGHADAASLRTMTTLHSANVYLRDLFDNAGRNADALLGPGPEPGGRIEVQAAQLNAIARQYGVAWQSVSMGDKAELERPGRPLKRDEAIDAVRTAVTASMPGDWDIELPDFSPPIVPFDTNIAVAASQFDCDQQTGRFTAILSITGDAMRPINARIGGRVERVEEVPVAATRLLPETVLRADNVRPERVRVSLLRNDVARSPDQIVGMALRYPVPAGQPLRLADLMRPPLVQRGAVVLVRLESEGLSVTGEAVAVDAGAAGDRIRVQNVNSHALLFAEVIGPNVVKARPDMPAQYPATAVRHDRLLADQ